MNDHGFVVCAYNRTTEKVDKFLANEAKGIFTSPHHKVLIVALVRYKGRWSKVFERYGR